MSCSPNIDNVQRQRPSGGLLQLIAISQYLAFIFYYTKLNGVAPAQADFQRYFSVTAPTVHQMILQLERKGLIKRFPKTARSLILCVTEDKLPKLK
jgi:DNA-binding MarR family transcriptional regulator